MLQICTKDKNTKYLPATLKVMEIVRVITVSSSDSEE